MMTIGFHPKTTVILSCNVDCYFQHEGICCIDSIDFVENDPEVETFPDEECALNQD